MLEPLDKPIVCPVTVGRELHLTAIDKLLDQLGRGLGQTLLITGEAGVGKSRMVAETASRALARDFSVRQGHCFETDRSLPYAPFIDMQLLSAAADQAQSNGNGIDPTPEQRKRRLFQTLAHEVAELASQQPLLLIVEDVHWADETSLELLRTLARTTPQRPVLMALTYRNDEISDGLRGLLTVLDRDRLAVELRLQRLSEIQLDAMLRAIFERQQPTRREFLDLMHGLTDGNPFFVEEVVRSLVGAGDVFLKETGWDRKPIHELRVPRSVEDAVQRRTVRLSDTARQVVALAAVAGRNFDFELLGSLSGLDEAQLVPVVKELISAGLVVEESVDRLAFRHALTRQAISAALLRRERRVLHRKVAEALEQQAVSRGDELSADLAYHYAEAAAWEPALRYARLAGERALRLYAPAAAVEQFSRALAAADALGTQAESEVLRLRAQAFDLQGDFERAQLDLEASAAAAHTTGDQRAEWQTLLDLSLFWARRSYERTGMYANQALELARAIGDARLVAQTLNRIGNWYMNRDMTAESLSHHLDALRLFEQLEDERGRAETLDLLGMASCGDARNAVNYFGQAIPLLRRLDDRPRLVTGLIMRMLCDMSYLSATGPTGVTPVEEATAGGEEALRIARDMGWLAGESFVLWQLSNRLGPRGDYGAALRSARAGLALAGEIEHRQWEAGARFTLGAIYTDLLLFDHAESELRTALELARGVGSGIFMRLAAGSLARAYALLRRFADADAVLHSAMDSNTRMDAPGQRACWLARAEVQLGRGDAAAALDVVEKLIGTASPGVAPHAWHVRGEALFHLGRTAEAVAVLEEARSVAEAQAQRGRLWRIEGSLARVLRSAGRREEAERVLTSARSTVVSLAANIEEPDLRQHFLSAATSTLPPAVLASPARVAKARFGGLTGRERDVARRIARGLSNRAIAEDLIVGERTIETYVGNILSKLGFSSRAQIAAWVVESGLLADAE